MDTMVLLAQGFIGMFNKGGETFVGWVGGIIPTLICLLVAMNSIIAFVGQEKIEKFARICGGNVITRYILQAPIVRIPCAEPETIPVSVASYGQVDLCGTIRSWSTPDLLFGVQKDP